MTIDGNDLMVILDDATNEVYDAQLVDDEATQRHGCVEAVMGQRWAFGV